MVGLCQGHGSGLSREGGEGTRNRVSNWRILAMTNEERLKQMGTQELARELSLIAMWDREQLRKAQKGPGLEAFMEKWLQESAVRE